MLRGIFAVGFRRSIIFEMEFLMNIKLVLLSFSLAGCATLSSGPVQIGRDTYMLARNGGVLATSGGIIKAELYREAYSFCMQKRKELMPVTESSNDYSAFQYASAEIQFRCLSENDPDLKRPTMDTSTKIRVELR